MKANQLLLPFGLSPAALLVAIFLNLFLSFAVAFMLGTNKTIGFWGSFIIGVVVSAVIGFLVTIMSKTKELTQTEIDFFDKSSQLNAVDYEIHKLEILRQSGVISNSEFKNEKKRLLKQ